MKHQLTYKDDKSDKFWNIEVSGESFTVTYGKTGTAGQTQTKTFGSEEECQKEAKKLLQEKLKKGYAEGEGQTSSVKQKTSAQTLDNFVKEWEEIVNAKDLHKALIRHFSYLADSPGYEKVLEAVMKEAVSAEIRSGNLVIKFGDDELVGSRPANGNEYKKWPQSFKTLIAQHRHLGLESARVTLGDTDSFEGDYLEESDSEWLQYGDPNRVLCPIVDYSDWWLYHPKEKNSMGEPTIHFFSHEGGDVGEANDMNAGSLFLERVADKLNLPISIPQKETTQTDVSLPSWLSLPQLEFSFENGIYYREGKFYQLGESWRDNSVIIDGKTLESLSKDEISKIIEMTRIRELYDIHTLPLDDLVRLEVLMASADPDSKKKLKNLNGIEKLLNLKHIEFLNHEIEDISSLSQLQNLEWIDLSYNKRISNIDALRNCNKLEIVRFSKNKISDITALKYLPKLKIIDLDDNPIKDILCLVECKSLKELKLPSSFWTKKESQVMEFQRLRPEVEIK
ncbi:leucine rich repeat protein [Leptospira weilii str. Ecochallenge]|uniref:Leucine rich repeat protein n=1 Tax=Leptospira weilii str. Ecochallenge TaxID=1049986 RepID=N1U881_9LEPT|nr:leucine rich repeat protein [Leptospira weilii str. Ecochallenge]